MVKKLRKIGIFHKTVKRIFNNKYLQTYLWFYKGVKLNILATKQKPAVAQNYKINPIQITTIIAENTENSLNSVSYTIDTIQFKNCEKFSPIVTQNHIFSSAKAIVTQTA